MRNVIGIYTYRYKTDTLFSIIHRYLDIDGPDTQYSLDYMKYFINELLSMDGGNDEKFFELLEGIEDQLFSLTGEDDIFAMIDDIAVSGLIITDVKVTKSYANILCLRR